MRRILLTGSLILCMTTTVPVFSASFDCKKAGNRVEKMICGNDPLGLADEQLAEVYSRLKRELPPAQFNAVQKSQRAWIKKRDRELCPEVYACMAAYYQRISELKKLLENGQTQNNNGPVSAADALEEANRSFTYRGEPIHPGLVQEFGTDFQGNGAMAVTVDVAGGYRRDEAYNVPVETEEDGRITFQTGESGYYSYKWLGRLENGLHVVRNFYSSGGSLVLQTLFFIRFHVEKGYDDDGMTPSDRLFMTVVRSYTMPQGAEVKLLKNGADVSGVKVVF